MKPFLLPALALVTLSACSSWWHREGVGFTGIDGEPKTLIEAQARNGNVSRHLTAPVAFAGLRPVSIQTDNSALSDLAKVAIENGGRSPANAVEVGGDRRSLMLSNVSVNGVPFAVLRTPEGDPVPIQENSGAAFAGSVPRLTGCLAAGTTFQQGRSAQRSSGYAVPINCK
ncbi:MAG: hypothetical protein AAF408_04285 [Pseudomonadota bacterium]